MITVKDLCKKISGRQVLWGATWEFPSDGCTYIEAPNGGGKSTLLKCVAGLCSYQGQIRFDGSSLSKVRNRLVAVFEEPTFYLDISGARNIQMLSTRKVSNGQVKRKFADSRYQEIASHSASSYSSGEIKWMSLARCLVQDYDYVLLDEIDTGLDAEALASASEAIRALAQRSTVIVTGHNANFYNGIADWRARLEDGMIINV
jgi:ABC-2 type transport system ATP-binding protein